MVEIFIFIVYARLRRDGASAIGLSEPLNSSGKMKDFSYSSGEIETKGKADWILFAWIIYFEINMKTF